ncbi:MAG: winged helix-turn-helix domain-containing protein, partial [Candidatus Cybelea sp.]
MWPAGCRPPTKGTVSAQTSDRSEGFAESLKLDPSDPRPLYVQLADRLVDAIEAKRVGQGDRLPAMRDLARSLDCALVTVSQAYELLAARGRAIARPGKG